MDCGIPLLKINFKYIFELTYQPDSIIYFFNCRTKFVATNNLFWFFPSLINTGWNVFYLFSCFNKNIPETENFHILLYCLVASNKQSFFILQDTEQEMFVLNINLR